REQMYMPSADPSHAASVAEALRGLKKSVILVGNGDIETRADAERYLACGCTEVAVGRAALGNPWIFRELSDPEHFVPPTVDEIKSLAISLVEAVVREHGEPVGVRESRSRAAYFIKGMRGAARVRERLNHAETLSEFVNILETIGEE
ncbi:MAG: tRNA-dihydrouridine synthase, partial [Clostridia bacterium]|nr:tRNA-dihydrouridine synthase [Clostridia bacterium]